MFTQFLVAEKIERMRDQEMEEPCGVTKKEAKKRRYFISRSEAEPFLLQMGKLFLRLSLKLSLNYFTLSSNCFTQNGIFLQLSLSLVNVKSF